MRALKHTRSMIKELTENPEKKFICKGQIGEGYVSVKNNAVVWLGKGQVGQSLTINHLQSGEWEEVKEPVTFMKVLERVTKAYVTKAHFIEIEVEHKLHSGKHNNLSDLLDALVNEIGYELGSDAIAKVLTEGKFYIDN